MHIYQADCYRTESEGTITGVSEVNKCSAICVDDMLFHPEGGGQPSDMGLITVNRETARVVGIIKLKGGLYYVLDKMLSSHDDLGFGDIAVQKIDWERRYRFMRSHTAAHLLMAAAKRIVPGYQPKGVSLDDAGLTGSIKFSYRDYESVKFSEIQGLARQFINEGASVRVDEVASIKVAADKYGDIFRGDMNLSIRGMVSIVVIDGIDANPCGGTHVKQVTEVRDISIVDMGRVEGDGVVKVQFEVLQ